MSTGSRESVTTGGDTAVRGEAVAWLIKWHDPTYRGEQTVAFDPCDEDDGICTPLYASPPATPVAAGGDGWAGTERDTDERRERALRHIAYNLSLSVPHGCDPESHYRGQLMEAIGTAARALEAAERTRNERASPSAAVTDEQVEAVCNALGWKTSNGRKCARIALEAALAAAPGGKEKASDDHPTPEEFARYLAWRFKEDGVEVKPEDALRVSRDLLSTFSIWNVMAKG